MRAQGPWPPPEEGCHLTCIKLDMHKTFHTSIILSPLAKLKFGTCGWLYKTAAVVGTAKGEKHRYVETEPRSLHSQDKYIHDRETVEQWWEGTRKKEDKQGILTPTPKITLCILKSENKHKRAKN